MCPEWEERMIKPWSTFRPRLSCSDFHHDHTLPVSRRQWGEVVEVSVGFQADRATYFCTSAIFLSTVQWSPSCSEVDFIITRLPPWPFRLLHRVSDLKVALSDKLLTAMSFGNIWRLQCPWTMHQEQQHQKCNNCHMLERPTYPDALVIIYHIWPIVTITKKTQA